MQIVYRASNGWIFNTEQECLEQEAKLLQEVKDSKTKDILLDFVYEHCNCEDDEGYSGKEIAEFVFDYIEGIAQIINEQK